MTKFDGFYRRDVLSSFSKYLLVLIFLISMGIMDVNEVNAAKAIEGPCPECVVDPPIIIVPDPDPIPEPNPDPNPIPDPIPDPNPIPDPIPDPNPIPDPIPDPNPNPIPIPTVCDDGLFCTEDIVVNEVCIHNEIPDEMIDECILSICDEALNGFRIGPAEDGTECGVPEAPGTCIEGRCELDETGSCEPGQIECSIEGEPGICIDNICQVGPVDCDDGLFCTEDIPQEDRTCLNVPIPDETYNECTTRVCDDDINGFRFVTSDAACDDGNVCNGQEICHEQAGCRPGDPINPDDGIPCTDDSCDPIVGVINAPDDSACDDGLFCTGVESCDTSAGCVVSISVPDDGIACTDRRCDEEADQYVFDPNDDNCDNGEFCDGVEICDPQNAEFGAGGCIPTDIPDTGSPCDDGEGVCNEEMMCVERTGTIKIIKVAIPPDGEDFRFFCVDENNEECEETDADNDGDSSFYLDDEGQDTDGVPNMMTFADIPTGIYIFGEVLPVGWGLQSVFCENSDGETVVDNEEPVIELGPFDEITCTFTNELLCGNGVLDGGEECDPGISTDNCDFNCMILDSDGDGVRDDADDCPDTPLGTEVDEFGCPIEVMTCDCDDPNAITQGFTTRRGTYFFGTFGDDIICGTSERDIIFGFSGNDCIDAGDGNDAIFAGFGNDIADGGDGRDFVHGGFGIDTCFGERLRRCE